MVWCGVCVCVCVCVGGLCEACGSCWHVSMCEVCGVYVRGMCVRCGACAGVYQGYGIGGGLWILTIEGVLCVFQIYEV